MFIFLSGVKEQLLNLETSTQLSELRYLKQNLQTFINRITAGFYSKIYLILTYIV